jgi:hypothetical protein
MIVNPVRPVAISQSDLDERDSDDDQMITAMSPESTPKGGDVIYVTPSP